MGRNRRKDRRKDGTLLIVGASVLSMLVLLGAAYVASQLLASAMFRIFFLG